MNGSEDNRLNQNPGQQGAVAEDEIDLVELFLILWKRKFTIIAFTMVVTGLTALHQLYVAKEIFRSDAVILPVSSGGGGGMLAQLGGLASFVGMDTPKSENTIEVILNSRSFAQDLVREFKLDERWESTFQEATSGARKSLNVEVSKKSPEITLSWEDEDPVFAQEIILRVLDLARQRMEEHAVSKKNVQVNFLEERVSDAHGEMMASENALRDFQEKNQSVEIEAQAQALITQLNLLKTEQQSKGIELEVAKKILTPTANEIKILDMTVDELNRRIEKLIGQAEDESPMTMDERSLMEIPKIGLEYARLLRQVKMNQKIYGLLVEQLEMSKIEAQKNVESFEVIDQPWVPEKRIKPKRTMTTAIAMVCSAMLAVMGVLLSHFIGNIRAQRRAPASVL